MNKVKRPPPLTDEDLRWFRECHTCGEHVACDIVTLKCRYCKADRIVEGDVEKSHEKIESKNEY